MSLVQKQSKKHKKQQPLLRKNRWKLAIHTKTQTSKFTLTRSHCSVTLISQRMTTYSKYITLKQTNNNLKRQKMSFKQKREHWNKKLQKLKEAMTNSARRKKHQSNDLDTLTVIFMSQNQFMVLRSPRRLQYLILLRKWPRYVEIQWFKIKLKQKL